MRTNNSILITLLAALQILSATAVNAKNESESLASQWQKEENTRFNNWIKELDVRARRGNLKIRLAPAEFDCVGYAGTDGKVSKFTPVQEIKGKQARKIMRLVNRVTREMPEYQPLQPERLLLTVKFAGDDLSIKGTSTYLNLLDSSSYPARYRKTELKSSHAE